MRPQEECIHVRLPIVGPTSHYFYSQRLKLHYVDWGNPEKPLMVLVHGGRDHARNWDQVAPHFRPRITLSRPTCAGTGIRSGRTAANIR